MAYKNLERKRAYRRYFDMKERCNNPESPDYTRYGGRGIKVCERWLKSFDSYLEDMGLQPSPLHTVDRINNDGDYTPKNCRWATRKEQALNRSSNTSIKINGVTKTLSQWIESLNLKPSTVRQRYYVYKWSAKKSLGIGG